MIVKEDGHNYQVNQLIGVLVVGVMDSLAVKVAVQIIIGLQAVRKKHDSDSRSLFWQELWAHVPSTKKRSSEHIRPSLLQSNPTDISDITTNTNSIRINAPHSSRK